MLSKETYVGREQSFVKHYVLENYLERLAFKIGMGVSGATLNYVDGFSGPWQHADEQLQDTSPFIAIGELRRTAAALEKRNRQFNFRCLFIEKDAAAFRRLEAAAAAITDAEIRTLNGEFEDFVEDAAKFALKGSNPFGFFFIDPTGWTGYPMSKLRPLFANRRSELLINFMTSFIERFVDTEDPALLEGFQDLFGDASYRRDWNGLAGLDREDAIVQAYCDRLKHSGRFSFVGSSIILDPHSNQTCYHLVYATHHPEGMRVFREVEAKAFKQQESLRATAAQDRRAEKTGMPDLFEPSVLASRYDVTLLERYHTKAEAAVVSCLEKNRRVSYDVAEEVALSFPLTSATDLKEWIAIWVKEKKLVLEGLKPKARVPKPRSGHCLIWK